MHDVSKLAVLAQLTYSPVLGVWIVYQLSTWNLKNETLDLWDSERAVCVFTAINILNGATSHVLAVGIYGQHSRFSPCDCILLCLHLIIRPSMQDCCKVRQFDECKLT